LSGSKIYTAALIGCGDIGYLFDKDKGSELKSNEALTHFRALNISDHFKLVSVADTNLNALNIIDNQSGIKKYDDYRIMLEEQKPDLVTIASDDESHYPILTDILKFKPKFVFCEKPLAKTFEEIKEVSRKYNEAEIPLQVNYTRRFLNEFEEIKKSIDENKIGKIESVTFYYSRGLVHNASHYIDIALWYFGEPDDVISISEKRGITDEDKSVSFILKYSNGPEIIFIALDIDKLSFAEIDIIGTLGRIKYNYKGEIEIYTNNENPLFKGYKIYECICAEKVKFERALPEAYENIFEVMTGNTGIRSNSENSIKIFKLIKRIREKSIWQN